jgi:raffinose/stachyose/melibiose transport system permease protein
MGKSKTSITSYQRPWIIGFISPALVLTFVFTTLPALTLLSYSFFEWKSFRRIGWAGFDNFTKLMRFPFRDQFLGALQNNVEAFVSLFILQTALGLFFAFGIYRLKRGRRFFQAVIFLPVIFSLIIVAFMWKLFLDPLFGPVNMFLTQHGLASLSKPWLGDPHLAMPVLILIGMWRWVGFPAIVFLAGMNGINEELIEAARIDGASEIQIFRKVMFPLLAPSFTIIAILTFIGAFEWFELPYVVGGVTGQPGGSTTTLVLLFYRLAFGTIDAGTTDVGLSSAVGVILFIFVGIGAAVGSVYLRRREVEQ